MAIHIVSMQVCNLFYCMDVMQHIYYSSSIIVRFACLCVRVLLYFSRVLDGAKSDDR